MYEMAGRSFNFSAKLIIFILSLSFYVHEISSLYEDQAGKFDWRKSFIGKVKYADFGGINRVIVATEENVLACLSVKTGDILWRQELENSAQQQIELFSVNTEIITVSGRDNNWYVRGWEINNGILMWEWTINTEHTSLNTYWSISNRELILVDFFESSYVQVNIYHLELGEVQEQKSMKIPASWYDGDFRCATTKNFLACIQKKDGFDAIAYVDLSSDLDSIQTIPINLPGSEEADILSFENKNPSILFIKNNKAIIINIKSAEIIPTSFISNVISVRNEQENQLYQLEINVSNPDKLLRIKGHDENGELQISVDVEYPKGLGAPYILTGQCRTSICDLLLTSVDHALIMVRVPDGKISWIREEALSDIVAVEFFELPVSELDASIESEFKTTSRDMFSMFIHRITTQTIQFSNLLFGSQLMMNNMLVRDDFGLHKIIVVVTRVGKLFALDTLSGHIVWSYRLPHVVPFENGNEGNILLFVQRTARYSPLPAQCSLLASDDVTGITVLFQFDPITGFSSQGVIKLKKKVLQAMLLPYEDKNHLKPFITIDNDGSVDVYPKQANSIVETHLTSIYFYIVVDDTINGYSLKLQSGRIKTSLHWNFLFRPSKLLAIGTRPINERVHSQGRVLPDRSVYYKYVNPNMIALATLSEDPVHKQVLSVYLIDGITGFLIYSVAHKRARGPINLVHSENWLVYTFFNERYRRTEMAALELYEGHVQSNSTFFSSYAMSQLPQVQAQSYILPAVPIKVIVTQTERGITNKCLLVALNTGAVVEIPWALIQPRFDDIPCGPEESCYPYMPEIPLHPEATINYNQTLSKVKGISVAPARLESTSHVLVHGLDMFYTKVAPSKTFDVLKEDFDHKLIILVLIGLILASYVTKTLASRKAIKQAWK